MSTRPIVFLASLSWSVPNSENESVFLRNPLHVWLPVCYTRSIHRVEMLQFDFHAANSFGSCVSCARCLEFLVDRRWRTVAHCCACVTKHVLLWLQRANRTHGTTFYSAAQRRHSLAHRREKLQRRACGGHCARAKRQPAKRLQHSIAFRRNWRWYAWRYRILCSVLHVFAVEKRRTKHARLYSDADCARLYELVSEFPKLLVSEYQLQLFTREQICMSESTICRLLRVRAHV